MKQIGIKGSHTKDYPCRTPDVIADRSLGNQDTKPEELLNNLRNMLKSNLQIILLIILL